MGTRTSGSEGGGEQTTARKRGMAACLRPYIECVRRSARNVKRWQSGDMALRWTAAGMLEAEGQFSPAQTGLLLCEGWSMSRACHERRGLTAPIRSS